MRNVYVASKDRPNAPTFNTLAEAGIGFTVIVEPQDADAYEAEHDGDLHLLLLEENDCGLAYARQAALDFHRGLVAGTAFLAGDGAGRGEQETHDPWYWMLDDDISGFYITDEARRKNTPHGARLVLHEAEAWLDDLIEDGVDDVGIIALEYQQFAWNATINKPTWNSYTDVATLINAGVLVDYRQELPLKVDRDFTLQVLATGFTTARLRWLSFSVPTNGTNEGGLHDTYHAHVVHQGREVEREEYASRRLAELWPGVVEFKTKPNGRPDAKIHWRRLTTAQPTLLEEA